MKRLITVIIAFCLAVCVPVVFAQETPPPSGSSYVVFDNIFVRGGPGEGYQPVGSLQAGVLLRPISRSIDGSWIMIAYSRSFGWIRRDLAVWGVNIESLPVIEEPDLTPTFTPGEETPTPFLPTSTPSGNWVNTGGLGAYLRTGPGLTFGIYGEIRDGVVVQPVGQNEDGTWILLRRSQGFAWINRTLVSWADDLTSLPILYLSALTPSATFTGTLTPSVTFTPSATASATVTPSPTVTLTRTPTVTPSMTASQTSTATATFTPTPTVTPSFTQTLTETPSQTFTTTQSPPPTNTPRLTETPTTIPPTITPTLTASHTAQLTVTPSPIPPTVTSTATSTNTVAVVVVVPTETPIPATATASTTQTTAPTATVTRTPSATITPSHTQTNVPSSATLTPIPPTNTPDMSFFLTGTAIIAEVNRRATATALNLPTVTPSQALLSLNAMNNTGTAIFAEINQRAAQTQSALTAALDQTPNASSSPIIAEAVPLQSQNADSPPVTVSPTSGEIAPELLVYGLVILLIVAYIGFYWRGATGVERYASGFVIERCPTCGRGSLHVETTISRSIGIPRARYTVRCSECRSVLRGAGVRRWRYAVDRIENPTLYERYNNKIVEESELARLTPGVGVTQSPHVRTPLTPPSFVDDEGAE